jgi:cobalamin biosynthesis protein CobT
MDNAQGGHELLHLQTNKVVKRRNLTKIPITPSIVKQVHALAELEEMPKGLKISSQANQVIFDSAWIAGVDYDEDLFDDEDHNEEDDGDENEDEENEANYDKMDENDLADILQQPNEFQVPHETENEDEVVFEEANNAEELQEEEEGLSEDDDSEEYPKIPYDYYKLAYNYYLFLTEFCNATKPYQPRRMNVAISSKMLHHLVCAARGLVATLMCAVVRVPVRILI